LLFSFQRNEQKGDVIMFDEFELQVSDVIYDNSLYVVPFITERIDDRSLRSMRYEEDYAEELNFDDEDFSYED